MKKPRFTDLYLRRKKQKENIVIQNDTQANVPILNNRQLKVLQSLKRFGIWTLLQYACILVYELVVFLFAYLEYGNARAVGMHTGPYGFYNFEDGLLLFIPVTTLAYSIWSTCRQSGKIHWTLIFPVVTVVCLIVLSIAGHLEWNIKIMSMDRYMLGCLSSLIFVPAFQFTTSTVGRFIHYTKNANRSRF